MKSIRLLAFTIVLLAAATPAAAGIVWGADHAPGDYTSGWTVDLSDLDPVVFFSGTMNYQAGDNVTFGSQVTLTDIHWWGTYLSNSGNEGPDGPDDFTLRIFAITGGVPAATPTLEVAIGDPDLRTGPINSIYYYEALDESGVGVTLPPGDYLFSLVNNTVGDDDGWWWLECPPIDGMFYRHVDGDPWLGEAGDLAFQLTNDFIQEQVIPEPATCGLLALGLAALARRRRKA